MQPLPRTSSTPVCVDGSLSSPTPHAWTELHLGYCVPAQFPCETAGSQLCYKTCLTDANVLQSHGYLLGERVNRACCLHSVISEPTGMRMGVAPRCTHLTRLPAPSAHRDVREQLTPLVWGSSSLCETRKSPFCVFPIKQRAILAMPVPQANVEVSSRHMHCGLQAFLCYHVY